MPQNVGESTPNKVALTFFYTAHARECISLLITDPPSRPGGGVRKTVHPPPSTIHWKINSNATGSSASNTTDTRTKDDDGTSSGSDTVTQKSMQKAKPAPVAPQSTPESAPDADMLQYRAQMHWMALHTCRCADIYAQTRRVATAISAGSQGTVEYWARRLLFAGVASRAYARTVAVLVHDVLAVLVREGGQHAALEAAMMNLVTRAFAICWSDAGRSSKRPVSSGEGYGANPQLLAIAAFAGDLFALGVLQEKALRALVAGRVGTVRATAQGQALHLLVFRAQMHVCGELSAEFLAQLRGELVASAAFQVGEPTRLWLVETCDVIDRVLWKPGTAVPQVCHQWSPELDVRGFAILLDGSQPTDYGLLVSL